jgi:hypothetical protein
MKFPSRLQMRSPPNGDCIASKTMKHTTQMAQIKAVQGRCDGNCLLHYQNPGRASAALQAGQLAAAGHIRAHDCKATKV